VAVRTENDIRSEIVETLQYMWDRGYANTTGVSISERTDEDRIIVDQSGTGFRRCKITENDLLVIDMEANLMEDAPNGSHRRAPANVIIHTEYYRANPLARVCVHCHAPYTQVFSCEKRDIHPYTLQSMIMGVVPCIAVDDGELKAEFHRKNISLSVPSGLHNRPDVFYVMREVARAIVNALTPRNEEMKCMD
jgi:ribulose-5-phosphate 4-epimerase/fuculose-1-phosphate aldolase